MLSTVHDALVDFMGCVSPDQRAVVASVVSMVQATIDVRSQGTVHLDEGELNRNLLDMVDGKLGVFRNHSLSRNCPHLLLY